MNIPIKQLSGLERHALERHFLALGAGDRRLRFGTGMMALARKQGMDIVTEAGEADAWLKLPPADASSYMGAVFQQRFALFDSALKWQLAHARRIADALKPGTALRAQEK